MSKAIAAIMILVGGLMVWVGLRNYSLGAALRGQVKPNG